MIRIAIALVLGGITAAPAFAQQIVKCTDTNGRIEYRNSPCPSGTRRETVDVSNLSIIEAERRATTADRRAQEPARAPRTAVSPPPMQPMLAPGSERGTVDSGTPGAGAAETLPNRQR